MNPIAQRKIAEAITAETVQLARATQNIERARDEGNISAEDAAKRIAKAEDWCESRIAWITSGGGAKSRGLSEQARQLAERLKDRAP